MHRIVRLLQRRRPFTSLSAPFQQRLGSNHDDYVKGVAQVDFIIGE